jgi:hypothetical protein
MAANINGTATTVLDRTDGIFTLGAALADSAETVKPAANVADLEPVEPLCAKAGDEVQPGEQRVSFSRLGRKVGFDDLAGPERQVAGGRRRGRRHRTFLGPGWQLDPIYFSCTSSWVLAVDPFAFGDRASAS